MSDFLRNLRSSHKQDKSGSKRNMTGHYYPQQDRRRHQDRRSTTPSNTNLDPLWDNFKDLFPKFVDNSSLVVDQFEKLVSQNDRLIEAKIREHNAISDFLNNLNDLFNDDFFNNSNDKKIKATASYTSGTHYTKDDILNIIESMRKDGSTFAIIADYLKEKGIPTFSGRGEWHAQTIHRLCK